MYGVLVGQGDEFYCCWGSINIMEVGLVWVGYRGDIRIC